MLTPVPPIECVQARESASARLDGELPELDDVRLDAHLRGCADCRAFADELAALAAELRAAPLERPETVVFSPRRRHMPAIRMQSVAAAVALVAAAAGSSFAIGRTLGTSGPAAPPAATAADLVRLHADSTEQHLLAMLSRLETVPARPGRLQAV
jgi:predicted anti-sigma-YlaC factor YlaD